MVHETYSFGRLVGGKRPWFEKWRKGQRMTTGERAAVVKSVTENAKRAERRPQVIRQVTHEQKHNVRENEM